MKSAIRKFNSYLTAYPIIYLRNCTSTWVMGEIQPDPQGHCPQNVWRPTKKEGREEGRGLPPPSVVKWWRRKDRGERKSGGGGTLSRQIQISRQEKFFISIFYVVFSTFSPMLYFFLYLVSFHMDIIYLLKNSVADSIKSKMTPTRFKVRWH